MKLSDALRWSEINKQMRSDGCTLAPDCNFTECCEMHDRLVRSRKVPRIDADMLLRECIESKGHKYLAALYYFYVRGQAKFGIPMMVLFTLITLIPLTVYLYHLCVS